MPSELSAKCVKTKAWRMLSCLDKCSDRFSKVKGHAS